MDELKAGLTKGLRVTPKTKIVGEEINHIVRHLGCDPASLERAAQFFGLNPLHETNLLLVAHLLAEIIFSKPRRGRRWASKVWDGPRLHRLMVKYEWLKKKNPALNDTEAAEILSRYHEFKEYRRNPNTIRQKLPRVRRLRQELDYWAHA